MNCLRFSKETKNVDAIFDALISTKEEIFDIEAINDKTNILKALQEHYADNNTE